MSERDAVDDNFHVLVDGTMHNLHRHIHSRSHSAAIDVCLLLKQSKSSPSMLIYSIINNSWSNIEPSFTVVVHAPHNYVCVCVHFTLEIGVDARMCWAKYEQTEKKTFKLNICAAWGCALRVCVCVITLTPIIQCGTYAVFPALMVCVNVIYPPFNVWWKITCGFSPKLKYIH